MASPHAAGVAALIVSEYGERRGGGISLHLLLHAGVAPGLGCGHALHDA
jgi:hypothetical protein